MQTARVTGWSRVPEPRGRFDLGKKAICAQQFGHVRFEDLHSHFSIVPAVVSEIDRCHASGAELPIEHISVGKRGTEEWIQFGHFGGTKFRRRCGMWPAGAAAATRFTEARWPLRVFDLIVAPAPLP